MIKIYVRRKAIPPPPKKKRKRKKGNSKFVIMECINSLTLAQKGNKLQSLIYSFFFI